MQPNHHPYGQHAVPMQAPQRRHDGPYAAIPPPMRQHHQYQPYYQQHMAPMMPQYPQQYQPNWYGYQQPHMHPMHTRPPYYPQHSMPPPPYPAAVPPPAPRHGPLVVSSPQHVPLPPRQSQGAALVPQPSIPTAPSMASNPVHTPPSPPLSTSSTVNTRKETISPAVSPAPQRVQSPSMDAPREPFRPPVPWLSVEGEAFPPRAPRRRRRIFRSLLASEPVVYPVVEQPPSPLPEAETLQDPQEAVPQEVNADVSTEQTFTQASQASTPLPSDAPSDAASTQPTTPSSAAPASLSKTPTQPKARPVGPVIPAVPILPPSPSAVRPAHRDSVASTQSRLSETAQPPVEVTESKPTSSEAEVTKQGSEATAPNTSPAAPKSWANLFKSNDSRVGSSTTIPSQAASSISGTAKSETLSDVLNDMNAVVEAPSTVSFLKPRGLVNTGNMCYMNSVLQVLVFCLPFYDFIAKLADRAPHTFKSDTPLVDAIIMFIREYPIICSATSVDQLRLRLKPEDYENFGDSLIPEYVYAAIKDLPRFREMRRGHQQDAQEFLGFLLEELHEECARAMRSITASSSGRTTPVGSVSNVSDHVDAEGGWMEVGHKQKAAVTRSSGMLAAESPVTNIFGGKLRSELKVSGNKLSVTLEPYSPLQLDIGSPQVNNIIDALRGLTRPESMQGDFHTPRGVKATATKQVFIETLPPVLILHLKRFHYDNTTKRAEKIWKRVGYPLELEIPKEVFPLQVRNKLTAHGGLPKYRLTGVIYHHGKNANGGHYTVDIRRQDGREWIRMDDTLLRRIRAEDVAEGGSEEDPKVLAAALERHKATGNRFDQFEQEEEEDEASDKAWSQVNGHSRSKSTLSAVVNGTATPKESSGKDTPNAKYAVKDNKVAYLLFYQRIQ
ncbi:ubiquitin hydrolase [Cladophialophora carrionii]|uniref:Ubiquitin carboxyl-terminal hydrolase n=1 Tax=Cladophialophora carrionii TaxID=86049 RepID=A0A1C1CBH3_9EURO|nr:ubiquitin hydrolase [Cladophialophora carrionii]